MSAGEALLSALALPEPCLLGRRVFKKVLFQKARLGAVDGRVVREDVERVSWEYTVKPELAGVPPYRDEEREYVEIAVLQVELRSAGRDRRVAEALHRAIPYPVCLILASDKEARLSLAHKRFSLAEQGAIVAEEFVHSDPISPEMGEIGRAFLARLGFHQQPRADLHALYSGWIGSVTALACARRTGRFTGVPSEENEARRALLARCRTLEAAIHEKQAAIRQETQFNRQVELNIEIKQLQTELHAATAAL